MTPESRANGDLVFRYVQEGLNLEDMPSLNFTSFVITGIDSRAEKLLTKNIVGNLLDNEEYPTLIDYKQQ